MRIVLDESAYSEHFYELLLTKARYVCAFGGRGSGKTDHFYIKYLLELFQPYYFKLIYVNKEKANIREQQYAGFKRVAKMIGVYHLLRFYDGDYRIINPKNNNSLIPKGMDDPEKTKGIDDATAIWWDEINKGTQADFSALNDLLRSPLAEYLQFAFSFNPISEKHWLRKFFFDENDAYKFKAEFAANGYLNHSTYLNNEYINKEDYLQTLMGSANGLQSSIDVNIKGKWGVITKTDLFIYKFSKDKHTSATTVEPDRNKILYLSFDFNVNPMTCVVGQHDIHLRKIRFLKVYKMPDSGVYEICSAIQRDFPKFQYKVTGDAAGWSRNAASKGLNNNYEIIRSQLHLNWAQIVAPKANPLHTTSRTDCNALLEFHGDTQFNPECEFLIEDLQTVQANDKGGILKVVGEFGHLLDAWRYYVNSFLSQFKKTIQ